MELGKMVGSRENRLHGYIKGSMTGQGQQDMKEGRFGPVCFLSQLFEQDVIRNTPPGSGYGPWEILVVDDLVKASHNQEGPDMAEINIATVKE